MIIIFFLNKCFVPGMLAIGSKILNRPEDMEVAIRLGEACYWAYNVTPTGIGPEEFYFIEKDSTLNFDSPLRQNDMVLPDGITGMLGQYVLRPGIVFFL